MSAAKEAAKAAAAQLMQSVGQQSEDFQKQIQKMGEQPLATSGTLGTKINVIV